MGRLILQIFQDYGIQGLTIFGIIVGIIVNVRLFKLLFENHLKHLADDLKENIKETKCVKTEVINLKERVSHVEGQLEARRRTTTRPAKKKK